MIRSVIALALLVSVSAFPRLGIAAEPPAGFQQMGPQEFSAAIRQTYDAGTFNDLSQADQRALIEKGRTLLKAIDLSSPQLNYQTIEMIHWVCRYHLEGEDDLVRTALLSRTDDWAGKPYAEIFAKIKMMRRLKVEESVQLQEARRWVQAGATIDQVPKRDLSLDFVRQVFADVSIVNSSFNVQWDGLLTAPQSGAYRFSISPININTGFNPDLARVSMKVAVGGKTVISTPPAEGGSGAEAWKSEESWIGQSNFVNLTADQPVAIRVNYDVRALEILPTSTLHAILSWEGPGVAKAVIPSDRLKRLDNNEAGLKAVYTWKAKGQTKSVIRTDETIDFAWTEGPILLTSETSLAKSAAEAMWDTFTAANYLDTLAGPPAKLHPFLKDPSNVASAMSSTRRFLFLGILLQRPQLLEAVDAKTIGRVYHAFRFGNPDQALEVYGKWCTLHADLMCDLSDDVVFDGDARASFAGVATAISLQSPQQAGQFQAQYLELPDGRCSLPAAMTLNYSHLAQGKMIEWRKFLDARLAEASMTGDRRVNWLIARAHAREIGDANKHYPHYWPIPATIAMEGVHLVEQALEAAQGPQAKLRAARELAGRLAMQHQFEQALSRLQPLQGQLPQAEQATLAAWQQKLSEYAAAEKKRLANRDADARKTHVETLKQRRAQASKLGDAAAVNRYDGLIRAAESP